MTNIELFEKMKPGHTETYEAYYRTNSGLEFNYSDMFSKLIKDAARTNRFHTNLKTFISRFGRASEKTE